MHFRGGYKSMLLLAILLIMQMSCMVKGQDILSRIQDILSRSQDIPQDIRQDILSRSQDILSRSQDILSRSQDDLSRNGGVKVDHSYFRPKQCDVSGFPGTTAKNYRSPCPGLNVLANHGYLPRNGSKITPQLIKLAIMEVYNIDESLATILTQPLPAEFTLADLSFHNFIEHDASLVHDDSVWKIDPSQVNEKLVQKLTSKAKRNLLGKEQLSSFRRSRETDSAKTNKEFFFGVQQQVLAYSESAILLIGMGNSTSQTISVEHAKSFLQDERIPDGWKRNANPITLQAAIAVSFEIQALAMGTGTVAADF